MPWVPLGVLGAFLNSFFSCWCIFFMTIDDFGIHVGALGCLWVLWGAFWSVSIILVCLIMFLYDRSMIFIWFLNGWVPFGCLLVFKK